MTAINFNDGKLIEFSQAFDSRTKTLNSFYALVFFASGCYALHGTFDKDNGLGLISLGLVFTAASFLAAYRFINKAIMAEKLFVNKNEICLIKTGLLKTQKTCYAISKISNFCHLPKPELTPHPLAGNGFDYLGFQTEQKLINEMHGDNRIAFEYEGRKISFGENIYSWEFEEIQDVIFRITGSDLSDNPSQSDFF